MDMNPKKERRQEGTMHPASVKGNGSRTPNQPTFKDFKSEPVDITPSRKAS